MEHTFTLTYRLPRRIGADDAMKQLARAGCTDALVGLGSPGWVGLEFTREAVSRQAAIDSALADVGRALPEATLHGTA